MRKPTAAMIVILLSVTLLPINASAQNPPAPQNTPGEKFELNTVLMECTFDTNSPSKIEF
jgi:hypothetical protein